MTGGSWIKVFGLDGEEMDESEDGLALEVLEKSAKRGMKASRLGESKAGFTKGRLGVVSGIGVGMEEF